jgi:G3E family GTPase
MLHIDVFIMLSSQGMRRSLSDPGARHLAGASDPIIQLSATPQRCLNFSEIDSKKAILSAPAVCDKGKVPATMMTGFLGSGKTILLNYLPNERYGFKFAIIETEFEEVGISDGPVFHCNKKVIEILNGFLCRPVRDDIVVSLQRFFTHMHHPHHQCYLIMIETTNPAPVVQTFFVNEVIQEHLEPDAIVIFLDAKHTMEPEHLMEERPQGVENVAIEHVVFVDVWVIKKTDLVTPEELGVLRSELKGIKAFAKTCDHQQSRVPVDRVVNTGVFDLQKTISMDDAFFDTHSEHMRDKSVKPVGIDIKGKFFGKKLNQDRINLLTTKGADIFRSKGSLSCVDDDRDFVFQGVQMLFKISTRETSNMQLKNWQKIINKLFFIGKKCILSEIEKPSKSCIVGVKLPGPGPATTNPLHLNSGDSVLSNKGTSEPPVAPILQSSKGMRRSRSSDPGALDLAGANEPIIQLSATPQRCFNSQTLTCGLLMVLVLFFRSLPFGFIRMQSAQEFFNFLCYSSVHLQLVPLMSTSLSPSFTECAIFNFAAAAFPITCLLVVMIFFAKLLQGTWYQLVNANCAQICCPLLFRVPARKCFQHSRISVAKWMCPWMALSIASLLDGLQVGLSVCTFSYFV